MRGEFYRKAPGFLNLGLGDVFLFSLSLLLRDPLRIQLKPRLKINDWVSQLVRSHDHTISISISISSDLTQQLKI